MEQKKIKVVHLTTSVSRENGGLFESVRHLSRQIALQDPGIQLNVIGTHDNFTDRDLEVWEPVTVRTHKIWGPRNFAYSPRLTTDLLATDPDLVHAHGLWRYHSIAVTRWARRTGKPYLVSPHGMLEPWSLGQSRVKKLVAGWLYQWPCLEKAACLRATSTLEAQSIRLAGFNNPIALVPNGVVMPEPASAFQRKPSDPRTALFLSRIHPKKGLINLVEAWHRIDPPGWRLIIVGPDEAGHLAEVQKAVAACGLEKKILFQNELLGEAKTRCYREADLFVLPSYSENFGLVIAEALSCGVPVITTQATPWKELETQGCGWWIPLGVDPLVEALRSAMALTDPERREMGERGRRLIESHYTWPSIARQMCLVYLWMLGRIPKPECIITDATIGLES